MRFDNKDTGLFTSEASEENKPKKKKKIKITEDQYNRLFKKRLEEEDEAAGGDTGGSSAPSGGGDGSEWESGATTYLQMTHGKANPIDSTSVWDSGVSRGKGNSWV